MPASVCKARKAMNVIVSGLQILNLNIPAGALRGTWSVDRDCGYVDHRRVRRHLVKLKRSIREFERSPEGVRKRLEEAKLLRQCEIEADAKRFLRGFLEVFGSSSQNESTKTGKQA